MSVRSMQVEPGGSQTLELSRSGLPYSRQVVHPLHPGVESADIHAGQTAITAYREGYEVGLEPRTTF
jgi:hypothetical protein